ncbi:MAG: hypothetical protein JSV99_06040 [Planctomycetota bacterium]|nr:MAG: hypothetical protein JSV99_06040 [Planctomycetota bacterium]
MGKTEMFENENDFKKLIDGLNVDTEPDERHRQILRRQILSAFNKAAQARITLRLLAKLAAAAVIVVAVGLGIIVLEKSATPAYAIDQTIEANRGLRYLHTKWFDPSYDDVAKECWLELDEKAQPKNIRIHWSKPFSASRTVVVWTEDRTQEWHKKDNRLIIFNDEIYTSRIHNMTETDDPRLMVEDLYEKQAKGEVEIEIDEPSNKSEPIIVTSTDIKTKGRLVLFVDQSTKLVTSMEWHQFKDGQYEYKGVMEYYDYNVPIDAKMFSLDDEVSPDAHCINTETQDIGLQQGNLTDKEIAIKLVREFFEALIAKDYYKAGLICGGLTADEIQKGWGKLNVVRIVSIGEPAPPTRPSKVFPKVQSVPYTIEREKNGSKIIHERYIAVRRVLGRRDRWAIH